MKIDETITDNSIDNLKKDFSLKYKRLIDKGAWRISLTQIVVMSCIETNIEILRNSIRDKKIIDSDDFKIFNNTKILIKEMEN